MNRPSSPIRSDIKTAFLDLWQSLRLQNATTETRTYQEQLTGQVLLLMAVVVIPLSLPVVIGWFLRSFPPESLLLILLLDASILIGWVLCHGGHWRIARYIPITITFALATYGNYSRGLNTLFNLFYVIAILLTGILFGIRSQWILVAGSIATCLVLGWLNEQPSPDIIATATIQISGFFIGFALLQQFFVSRLQHSLAQSRQYNQELEEKSDQQKHLFEAAHLLTSLNLSEVLQNIATSARHLLHAEGCTIYLLEEDGETLSPVSYDEPQLGEVVARHPLHLHRCLTGLAILRRQGLILNDLWSDDEYKELIYELPGVTIQENERVIIVPLLSQNQAMGAIHLYRFDKPFTEQGLSIAETLAAYAATAVKNAQAHDHLKQEIEERVRTAETLKASETRLSSIFRVAPVGIGLVANRVILDVNDRLREMIGYSRQELIGNDARILYPSDEDYNYVGEEKYDQIRRFGTGSVETRFLRKDGRIIHVLLSSTPLNPSDLSLGVTFTVLDITERKRAQADIMRRLELEKLLAEINDSFIGLPPEEVDAGITDALRRIGEFAGAGRAYLYLYSEDFQWCTCTHEWCANGIPPLKAQHKRLPTEPFAFFHQFMRNNQAFLVSDLAQLPPQAQAEKEAFQLQGIQSILCVPVTYHDSAIGFVGFDAVSTTRIWSEDLVPILKTLGGSFATLLRRREAEEALRKSEEKYRSLVESLNDIIFTLDLNGNVTYVNPVVQALGGYTVEEVIGQPFTRFIHPQDLERLPINIEQILAGQNDPFELRTLTKEGQLRYALCRVRPIWENNKPIGIAGVMTDITPQKEAEILLREGEERYRKMFESSPDSIFVKDRERRYVWVNPGMERLLALPASRIVGSTDLELFGAEAEEQIKAADQRVLQGEKVEALDQFPVRGIMHSFQVSKIPLRDALGNITGLWGIAHDITERAQRQRELESIAELTTALRLAQSNHEIISTVLDHAHSLFQAESTAIGLLDPARNEIAFDHIRGSFAHLRGLRIPADQGIRGITLRSRQPYLTQDASQDPLFLFRDQVPPNSCLAALPLFAKDLPIGVLLTLRQAPFSQTDLRLLTAFAEIAANAIHRASLHEETQRRLQHLSALHNIDLAITSNLDLDTTLQVILAQVTSQLNIHAADILLFDPPSQTLIYAAGSGFRSNAILSTALRIGAGLAGKAALSRQIILLPDISLQDPPTPGPKQLKTLEGFVSYAAVPLIAKDQVKGVLEIYHRSPLSPSPDWLDLLNTLATQAAIAIDNASLFDNLQRSHRELQLAYDATLQGWANALELRDKETEGHSQRVTQMTLALAQTLHFPDDQLVHLRRGALLHDIGKMAIPDSILLKPASLSEDEWTLMRQHPTFAYQLLSPIAFLHPALDIPYCHHEKWDGSGYPQGLKGEQIPLPARIFAVVDVFDALTSERPYRPAWTRQDAIRYIREQAGIHFDPKVVEAFLKVVDTFE